MALGDPIKFRCAFDKLHGERDGNVILNLEVPASEAAKAALFLVMGQIEFEATFVPVDARPDSKKATI